MFVASAAGYSHDVTSCCNNATSYFFVLMDSLLASPPLPPSPHEDGQQGWRESQSVECSVHLNMLCLVDKIVYDQMFRDGSFRLLYRTFGKTKAPETFSNVPDVILIVKLFYY